MCKWFKEMDCYLFLNDNSPGRFKMDKITQRAKLESSFRNYAAVFEKVKIVINESQIKEHYLNFPYIVHTDNRNVSLNLSTLLEDATSDAIFVGHTNLVDFPISILANLIKSYNGEMFMGYNSPKHNTDLLPFGIYHKSIISQQSEPIKIDSLKSDSYTLLPIPESGTFLF